MIPKCCQENNILSQTPIHLCHKTMEPSRLGSVFWVDAQYCHFFFLKEQNEKWKMSKIFFKKAMSFANKDLLLQHYGQCCYKPYDPYIFWILCSQLPSTGTLTSVFNIATVSRHLLRKILKISKGRRCTFKNLMAGHVWVRRHGFGLDISTVAEMCFSLVF